MFQDRRPSRVTVIAHSGCRVDQFLIYANLEINKRCSELRGKAARWITLQGLDSRVEVDHIHCSSTRSSVQALLILGSLVWPSLSRTFLDSSAMRGQRRAQLYFSKYVSLIALTNQTYYRERVGNVGGLSWRSVSVNSCKQYIELQPCSET